MNIKTYQANSVKEALDKVKSDLGKNAIILSTRTVKRGGGSFGMFARQAIEVTAVLDNEQQIAVGAETATTALPRKRTAKRRRKEQKQETEDVVEVTKRPSVSYELEPLRAELAELKEMISSSMNAGDIGRTELKKAAALSDDLENMKSIFNFMLEQSGMEKELNLGTNHMICYRRMIERGIEPQYALSIIKKVKELGPGNRDMDMQSIIKESMEIIEKSMMIGDAIRPLAAGPRIASLIGPTGVGKTTTVAKIAAELTLEGKKVGLITIDTFRIAAVEQLKIYAGILNIPLEVVMTPDELDGAISRFATKDVILIDTAGRSQRDSEKLDELSAFLSRQDMVENYLVLSAASEPAVLDESVRNFGNIPVAGLIFTKMDETLKPGVVISQNFKTGLPVVYTTDGQKVPEDIEAASARKMALKLFKKDV